MLAKLHVKQLLNTTIPVGSVVLSSTTTNVDWTSNSTAALLLPSGTAAQQPTGINGYLRYNSDAHALESFINGAWQTVSSAASGAFTAASYTLASITVDTLGRVTAASNGTAVTSVAITSTDLTITGSPITTTGAFTLTLPTTTNTSGAGTYTSVSVNTKGQVTAGTNPGFLTANQSVTLSGDVTGSGTTAITTALSTTGVTATSYKNANITVDAKGRITTASNGVFTGLADAPTSYSGAGSQFLQANAGATGLQFFTGTMVQRYTFTVQLSGSNPTVPPTSFPTGWTFSLNGTTGLNVVHGLGRQPIGCITWVSLTAPANNWRQSVYGVTTTFSMQYNDTVLGTTVLLGLTASNTGGSSASQVKVELIFTAA